MDVMYFSRCKSLADVEATNKAIYQLFGLKGQPKDHWLRAAVDTEFQKISTAYRNFEKAKSTEENEPTLDDILEEIQKLRLNSEVCGKWVWLSDRNAFRHKDRLRELGFRYARNKRSFYWRSADCKSFNQDPLPMQTIREKFGSKLIEAEV